MIYETKFHVVEPEAIETIVLRNPVLGEVVAALSILSPQQVSDLLTGLRARTFEKAGISDPRTETSSSLNNDDLGGLADSLEICIERTQSIGKSNLVDNLHLRALQERLNALFNWANFQLLATAKQSVNVAPSEKDNDLVELTKAQLENMRELRQAVGDDKISSSPLEGVTLRESIKTDEPVCTEKVIRDYSVVKDGDLIPLTVIEYKNQLDPIRHRESFDAAVVDETFKFFDLICKHDDHDEPALIADIKHARPIDAEVRAMWRGFMLAKGFIRRA